MKMYASCPICGYKLCKGESGSDVDILCPRCGKLVRVVITETNTNCTPTDAPKKTNQGNHIKICPAQCRTLFLAVEYNLLTREKMI